MIMGWLQKLRAAGGAPAPTALPAGALLVDVRSEAEFAGGHLAGALNLPLSRIADEIGRHAPDHHQALVLYCHSGARSGHACSVLASMGYAQVVNGGGVGSLAAALERPLVRGPG